MAGGFDFGAMRSYWGGARARYSLRKRSPRGPKHNFQKTAKIAAANRSQVLRVHTGRTARPGKFGKKSGRLPTNRKVSPGLTGNTRL